MTSINTNINALTASNALSRNGRAQQDTMLGTGQSTAANGSVFIEITLVQQE